MRLFVLFSVFYAANGDDHVCNKLDDVYATSKKNSFAAVNTEQKGIDNCTEYCKNVTGAVPTLYGYDGGGVPADAGDQLCPSSSPASSVYRCSAPYIWNIQKMFDVMEQETGLFGDVKREQQEVQRKAAQLAKAWAKEFGKFGMTFTPANPTKNLGRSLDKKKEFEQSYTNAVSTDKLASYIKSLDETIDIYKTYLDGNISGLHWQAKNCQGIENANPPRTVCPVDVERDDIMLCCCRANGLVSYGSEDPCFPSDATVTLSNGKRVRIDTLKANDAIIAATATGGITTDVVSMLSIADPVATNIPFLKFTTTAGLNITVTPEHHLSVGTSCCSTVVQAKFVRIGETLYTARAGDIVAAKVSMITKVVKTGLHSPVLVNGNYPVVDDFVTSFDSSKTVSIAGTLIPYSEWLFDITGTADIFRRLFLKRGHKYIDGFHSS